VAGDPLERICLADREPVCKSAGNADEQNTVRPMLGDQLCSAGGRHHWTESAEFNPDRGATCGGHHRRDEASLQFGGDEKKVWPHADGNDSVWSLLGEFRLPAS
jgi:hypothetical protein